MIMKKMQIGNRIRTFRIHCFILMLSAILGLQACHDHDHGEHGHDHGTEDAPAGHADHEGHDEYADHEDHGAAKKVELNRAQYQNAEIDTGWFEMKNLSDVVHANGYTKLDPQDQADVSMPVTGTIKSIKVIEGNYVKKGELLARMSSLEFGSKLLDKAKLEETAAVSQAKISYLEKDFARQSALAQDNINARKTLEKVSADLEVERAKIIGVRNQMELLNKSIGLIGNSAAGSLAILAPINGHVTHVDLKIGATVNAGTTMFSLVDNSKMHVDLLVYEKDLGRIKVGQKVRFILTNQSNKEIQGEIYNIGKSFASDTKSVAVHADIEENDANLIPGMYINALIDVGSNEVQAVPEGAVVRAEGREFVFLWEIENKPADEHDHAHDGEGGHSHDDHGHGGSESERISFRRLEVKTGARQLGYVEVTPLEQINDGDKVVTDGAYYLQSHLQKAEGGGGHHH